MADKRQEQLGQEDALLDKQPETKLYKFRWVVLFLYVLYAGCNAMQWIQYCVISDIVMRFYGVSALAVNWTSLVAMVSYMPLVIPGTYIIDRMGLRVTALIGALGTAVGTWIKVFSVHPDLFYVGFIGQTVVFLFQIFILSLPPRIAAVWFGPNEISTACALGAFGTQLGTAIGFIMPPMVVQNVADLEIVASGIAWMFNGAAAFMTIVSVLVIIFFKSEPELPPSQAQVNLRVTKTKFSREQFYQSYKALLSNKPFLGLVLAYGMNVGVYAGICTVLNQFVLTYFPENGEDSGRIGMLLIVVGILGSAIIGYFLDKTKRFKETTLALYVMVTFGVLCFAFALKCKSMVLVYITASFMGFFQNAYYPVGFELATELTFPEPESTSSGLLITSAQTFGFILTLLMDSIFTRLGPFWALISMVALLTLGSIITALTPNILKRQQALKMGNKENNFKENSTGKPLP